MTPTIVVLLFTGLAVAGLWLRTLATSPQFERLVAASRDAGWRADIRSAQALSASDCATRCLLWPTCLSFEFVPAPTQAGRLCHLSDQLDGGFPSPARPGSVMYSRRGPFCLLTAVIHGDNFCVIQQRTNGRVSFVKNWDVYENGFGDRESHWIGLKKIHQLTGSAGQLLRVEVTLYNGSRYSGEFTDFRISGPETNYTLNFTAYLSATSNVRDSLKFSLGAQFSTLDVDNDAKTSGSCSAVRGSGGWWYIDCAPANLNGLYCGSTSTPDYQNMYWWYLTNAFDCIIESRLLLKF